MLSDFAVIVLSVLAIGWGGSKIGKAWIARDAKRSRKQYPHAPLSAAIYEIRMEQLRRKYVNRKNELRLARWGGTS